MSLFEVRDPEFHKVIPKTATLETLVSGIAFGEGPIWHPIEHYLIFSDIISSVQYRWIGNDRHFGVPPPVKHGQRQCVRPGGQGAVLRARHISGRAP